MCSLIFHVFKFACLLCEPTLIIEEFSTFVTALIVSPYKFYLDRLGAPSDYTFQYTFQLNDIFCMIFNLLYFSINVLPKLFDKI